MERSPEMEGSPADPSAEWGEARPDGGLWQFGSGGDLGPEKYPERPDEADCIYFLRTGFCGYAERCRFNHPRDRSKVMGAVRPGGGDYPDRAGQPVCQYYMRTGFCKFGASCKYHHPRKGGGSASPAALNTYGYPLRPDEKECSYYVKTWRCKFGAACKFHHPEPAAEQVPVPTAGPLFVPASAIYLSIQSPSVSSSQSYGVVAGNWPVLTPARFPGSYLQGAYGPMLLPSGMVPFTGWNPYQAPLHTAASLGTQSSIPVAAGLIYGTAQLSPSASAYTEASLPLPSSVDSSSSSKKKHRFPERPGLPECQHYMKTGDCKFGSSCKYHHPLEWSSPKPNFTLSSMGLPLHRGAPVCTQYAQNGICIIGPSCKFDHPLGTLNYSPSASSLADMPVAPYPVGSSTGTLGPSSSSSELSPELTSGSNKDASSTQMLPSASTSSGSVPSVLSKSYHDASRGGEVRTLN